MSIVDGRKNGPAGESKRRMRRARWPATAVLLVIALVPLSCATPSSNLGGDACLLQQYQSRGSGIVHDIQSGVGTVTSHVDALSAQPGSINASQDLSETRTALAEFRLMLDAEWNLLRMGARPPEGEQFRGDVQNAVNNFEIGTRMLMQAYDDAGSGDVLAANAIAAGARVRMHQGRVMIGRANSAISALATYSPNC